MKIRTQIFLTFLVLIIIPTMIVHKIFFNYARQELQQNQFSKLNIIADSKVNIIKSYFNERVKDLRELQNDIFIVDYTSRLNKSSLSHSPTFVDFRQELDQELFPFLKTTGYQDIMLLNSKGTVLYSSNPVHYQDEVSKPYMFKKGISKDTTKIYTSEVFDYKRPGYGREIYISGSIHKDGEFIGTIIFELNMNKFYTLIQGTTGLGRSGETVLARPSRDHALVLNPLRHDPKAALTRVISFADVNGRPIQRAVQGDDGAGLSIDYRGVAIICVWRYLPEQHWGMVVKIDQEEAFTPITRFKKIVTILLAFSLFAIAIASILISRKILAPLGALRKGVGRIADGNLDFRLDLNGRDEISQLAASFNEMAVSLSAYDREMNAKVASRTIELENLNKELRILSSAVQQSPLAIIITDCKWLIEYVNPAFSQMTGCSIDDVKGNDINISGVREVIPDAVGDNKLPQEEIYNIVISGGTWQGEHSAISKDGRQLWLNKIVSPVTNKRGNISHFIIIEKDISIRKNVEERLNKQIAEQNDMSLAMLNMLDDLEQSNLHAKAANMAKSDFLANMSHEIRTPMNAIIGMTYLTMKTDLDPQQRDYLEKIQISSQSLLDLINDVLDISKIEAGRLELEQVEFNIHDIIDKIIIQSAEKIAAKGVELLVNIDPNIPDVLIGDPVRLYQVFNNLLSNAAKFTDTGEIEVLARVITRNKHLVLECAVIDTGVGIKENAVSAIFQKFTQADSSTTRQYGGSGLGLAICQQLVEMMGGKLRVESDYGQGTKFSFNLTLDYRKDSISKKAAFLPFTLRGLKVLVVDGLEKSQKSLCESLASLGLLVSAVPDCHTAFDEILAAKNEKVPFELMVVDFKRAKADNFRIAKKLQASAEFSQVPLIITASVADAVTAKAMADKKLFFGVITKPPTTLALSQAITTILGYEDSGKVEDDDTVVDLSGITVLLVEDSIFNQQVACEVMKQAKMEVEIANNGQEALEMVQEKPFDLVLMDIQMPVMDGLTAARAIRDLGGKFTKLPIVAMSANAMVEDQKKSLAAGMNDHINKPFDPDELYLCLSRWTRANGRQMEAGKGHGLSGLPGFDMERGIKQVGNNRGLYFSLMSDFARDHADFAARFRDAVAVDDYETAKRLTHTLKGIAGTIGAIKLQEMAAKLENDLQDSTPDISGTITTVCDGQLREIDQTIRELTAAIKQRCHTASTPSEPAGSEGAPLDAGKMSVELKKLNKLLTLNSMAASQLFESLKETMADNWPQETGELDGALNNFDFKTACKILGKIRGEEVENA